MIFLIEKEKFNESDWCVACTVHSAMGEIDPETCDYCLGYIVTYYKCPDCDAINHFFGYDNPSECSKCEYVFPDLDFMKARVEDRVEYHIKEEAA